MTISLDTGIRSTDLRTGGAPATLAPITVGDHERHEHPSGIDLTALVQRYAYRTRLWRPLVEFDPVSRFYARLDKTDDYEVWLLTWLPGQGTDWHDHGGSAGAFVTVQGTLTERYARPGTDGVPTVVPAPNLLTAGAVRAFGTRHIHHVSNDRPVPAVSLHAYAPALTVMNRYAPRTETLHLAHSEQAGADW
jgi:predicted metal-dependent enzyme (double-stranded beta helix superfamily)